jgi:chorismate synthase
MDKRKPGQSRFTPSGARTDLVKVLSGVMLEDDGGQVTTGTPVSLLIENVDQRSKDYSDIRDSATAPAMPISPMIVKYGVRDYRGGGRSSARETAARVAAGGLARKVVGGVTVRAALVQMGPHKINRDNWDWDQVRQHPFFCPDPEAAGPGKTISTASARLARQWAR